MFLGSNRKYPLNGNIQNDLKLSASHVVNTLTKPQMQQTNQQNSIQLKLTIEEDEAVNVI